METRKRKRIVSINDYELPRKRTRSQKTLPKLTASDDNKAATDKDPGIADPAPPSTAMVTPSLSPAKLDPKPNTTSKSKKTTKIVLKIAPKKLVGSEKAPAKQSSVVPMLTSRTPTTNTSKKELSVATDTPLKAPLPVLPMSSSGLSVADKDVVKRQKAFMQKEQRLARGGEGVDFLLRLPTSSFKYVTKTGKLSQNIRYRSSSPAPEHPKIQEAGKNGTMTREKDYWYRGMPRNVKIPTAGIPSDKSYATLHADSEDAFHSRPSIKLFVPDILKAMLVDDWENITKNNQLVPLPHPHPVTKILEDYAAYETPKRPGGSSHVDILEETLAGLKEYFDKSLGRILLYRFERAQYAEMYQKWISEDPEYQGKTASDTYGPEHLMRLIVSLPELVAQTNMDQQSVNRLREELVKFCTWLSKNTTEYFVSHYESPPQDYIQKAKD
ncbi:MRG-domain-containing protein [Daldinia decipiens]|uniref:MRG-domain-containing protein n=1 Tax=Daldinia decipiens TaxID=326647 RepID=UPI0020C33321|nr:MRG-domain-containing protein [Daldinia decipiens]KAI1659122.1 MRG-domain-containing protein [Daldinia decipiens]